MFDSVLADDDWVPGLGVRPANLVLRRGSKQVTYQVISFQRFYISRHWLVYFEQVL